MARNKLTRVLALSLAAALLASSCSGDDAKDGASPVDRDAANVPIEALDEGSGGVASGPINGLLTVQPSFGLGLFDIDPDTGLATAVPGIASVESVDRNTDVIVSGGAAYTLGSKVRDGQTFAADVSVVKVDYATGVVTQVAPLGFDRETDDSDTLISHRLVAVAGDAVVVRTSDFGSSDGMYTVFDANSGIERSSFAEPRYSVENDGAMCAGGVSNLVGLSDGRVAGVALNGPAFVDLDTGEIAPVNVCGVDEPHLDDFVTIDQVGDYAVFNQGPAPTNDQLARLLDTELDPEWGFIEGAGDLWWIDADIRVVDDIEATVGGVVQFDLATGTVEAVHPLGAHLGDYIDCAPDGQDCVVSTIEQAQMRYLDGQLFIVDGRENGKLLRLDLGTGDVRATSFDRGAGVDYTSTQLLMGDPDRIWLGVRRMTITQDDETGRFASGPAFIERFDPDTGQIVFSANRDDLVFN